MTKTADLINDRVKIANKINSLGFSLRHECDMDADFIPGGLLQSQYVEFKLFGETFTIRVADHAPSKPGMSACLFDTHFLSADQVCKALEWISANIDAAAEVYDERADEQDVAQLALAA